MRSVGSRASASRIHNPVATGTPPPLPVDHGYGTSVDACLLGDLTVRYLSVLTWPTVRLLSVTAESRLRPYWLAVRHDSRDGMTLTNDRCTTCGWWSRRLAAADPESCTECHDISICRHCSYSAPDGRRYCLRCRSCPQVFPYHGYYDTLMDTVGDALDALQLMGPYRPRRPVFLLRSWTCCFRAGTLREVWKAWRALARARLQRT